MDTILIKNAGWVVTMDPDRRIFADGAVAIEGDRIVEVGKTNELAARHNAQKVIDATGKMVLPGLIDLHTHVFWGVPPLGVVSYRLPFVSDTSDGSPPYGPTFASW